MKYRILGSVAALVTTLAMVGAFAATAQAATLARPSAHAASGNVAAEKIVVEKVANAANHAAAFRALSVAQKKLFVQSQTHLKATVIVSLSGRLRNLADAGGCWYHYQYDTWSNFLYVEGETWMQLDWCSNGPSITSYSTPLKGGKGDGGFSYDGVKGQGSLNVGWEIRKYVEFNFSIGPVHAYPCMQIRGGHTGLYSQSESCNLG